MGGSEDTGSRTGKKHNYKYDKAGFFSISLNYTSGKRVKQQKDTLKICFVCLLSPWNSRNNLETDE